MPLLVHYALQYALVVSLRMFVVNVQMGLTIAQNLIFAILRAWTCFTEITKPGAAKAVLKLVLNVLAFQTVLHA